MRVIFYISICWYFINAWLNYVENWLEILLHFRNKLHRYLGIRIPVYTMDTWWILCVLLSLWLDERELQTLLWVLQPCISLSTTSLSFWSLLHKLNMHTLYIYIYISRVSLKNSWLLIYSNLYNVHIYIYSTFYHSIKYAKNTFKIVRTSFSRNAIDSSHTLINFSV